MSNSVKNFYDHLAADYHSMFADWRREVLRQGKVLDGLIRRYLDGESLSVLDCTCGIGTQAIGLAAHGYTVHATDLVFAAIARARKEARKFGVVVTFDEADVRALDQKVTNVFDAVISFDNAISHIVHDDDLVQAARQMKARLRKDGLLLISIRDYDEVVKERFGNAGAGGAGLPGIEDIISRGFTQATLPRVFEDADGRRIIFQVWDWASDHRTYTLNHFHLKQSGNRWNTRCYATQYRALQRSELSEILRTAGFSEIAWLMPEQSGYYQPVVTARNR